MQLKAGEEPESEATFSLFVLIRTAWLRIMDNYAIHPTEEIVEIIENGVSIIQFLAPYSPTH